MYNLYSILYRLSLPRPLTIYLGLLYSNVCMCVWVCCRILDRRYKRLRMHLLGNDRLISHSARNSEAFFLSFFSSPFFCVRKTSKTLLSPFRALPAAESFWTQRLTLIKFYGLHSCRMLDQRTDVIAHLHARNRFLLFIWGKVSERDKKCNIWSRCKKTLSIIIEATLRQMLDYNDIFMFIAVMQKL